VSEIVENAGAGTGETSVCPYVPKILGETLTFLEVAGVAAQEGATVSAGLLTLACSDL
jgi:hypothetical protein